VFSKILNILADIMCPRKLASSDCPSNRLKMARKTEMSKKDKKPRKHQDIPNIRFFKKGKNGTSRKLASSDLVLL
jgi:hypothetical protein